MAHAYSPAAEPQEEREEDRKNPFNRSGSGKSPAELQLERVYRQVGNKENHHVIVLEQTFTNSAHEVWKALTDPESLAVWFESVELTSSEERTFRTGTTGTQGTVQIFDPPRLLQLTWENGDQRAELQISITGTAAGSSLTLRHRVPADDHWNQYGAGAVGVGWDNAFLALHAFLSGRAATVRQRMKDLEGSERGRRFTEESSKAWEKAQVAAGSDENDAKAQAERTRDFYLGQQQSGR